MQKLPIDVSAVMTAAETEARGHQMTLSELDITVRGLYKLAEAMLSRMSKEQLLDLYEEIHGDDTYRTLCRGDGYYDEYQTVAHLEDEYE